MEFIDPEVIHQKFFNFYSTLFGSVHSGRMPIDVSTAQHGPVLTHQQGLMLDLSFTPEEIKAALWSIPDEKAPGLDGFNSHFYKAAWDIVGSDVVQAITHFFQSGKLPRSWKTSTITLIPKVPCPTRPGDYRPISCCHVLYKCISKLICSRLKLVLGD